MSAILNFDFQKKKTTAFFRQNDLNYTKRQNFECVIYFFPKRMANKNKQWTHSGAL